MADEKLTALTAVTTYLTTDILYIVVDPGGTPASRKITAANVLGKIPTALLPSAAAGSDFGSATLPWKDVWFAGSSGTPETNNFKLTGASTGGLRTVTFPDASGTVTLGGNSFTGTGDVVRATSPTLVTPTLGVATVTSVNKLTLTAPATGATLTLTDGKTVSVTNTLTLSGTDGTTMTFPAISDTIAGLGTANVFTAVQTFSPAARASGVAPYLKITTPADTGQTADAEFPGIVFGGDASHATVIRTGADGTTIAEQREYRFVPPTYAFAGATVLTRAVSLYAASPVVGTNATFTSGIGALFEASAAAHVPLVLRGAGSQSGDNLRIVNSSNTIIAKFDNLGNLFGPNGLATAPTFSFTADPDTGFFYSGATGTVDYSGDGTARIRFDDSSRLILRSNGIINFSSGAIGASTGDSGIRRVSAGFVGITDGSGHPGQLEAGFYGTAGTVQNGLTLRHTGITGTDGTGDGILFNIDSSTTADRNAALIAALWTTATDASRTSKFTLSLVSNAAALAQVAELTVTDFNLASGLVYKINGVQVLGAQGAAVADASGGAVIDAEARTALNALLARLRTHGIIAT